MYFKTTNMVLKKPLFKKRRFFVGLYQYKQRSIFLKNKLILELSSIKNLLFALKRVYKKKKTTVYINLNKNHIKSKKPKNSRMGKGKGRFDRYVYKIKMYKPVFVFKNYSKCRFNHTKHNLNLKNCIYS